MSEMIKKSENMTSGNITRQIIVFAIPLLLGNIFQQLYNMVDTWTVGNFATNEAFSAVGTVGPIINMLIGFFIGFSNGAGVVISQYYGARHYERVQDTVHTAIVMTAVLSVVLTAAGVLLTPALLRLMNMPANVYPEAKTYLTIYFAGVAGLLFYNIGSSILQAIGDSRRPFYFLAVAAVLNIIGDLTLVIVFHMGVAGVAYATIFSQFISALLIMITLVRSDTCVKLSFSRLKIDPDVLAKIIRVGIPAALQMMIVGFANIFVQGYINYFGADCMSGWTAYSKVDSLMFLPMQSISLSVTTFVGQNIGVGNVDRARAGIRTGLKLSFLATLILVVPTVLFAPALVRFFNAKPEVITFGTMFLHWISPFCLTACVNQILAAALRGSGDAKAPMFIMIGSFVVFRQIYLFILTRFITNTAFWVGMSYPAGWVCCTILLIVYYKRADLGRHAVVD